MSTDRKCPKCGGAFGARDAADGSISCNGCGGVWVSEATLRAGIRAFLVQKGYPDQLVALQEMPGGPTQLVCPDCAGAKLSAIKLRAVEVERCEACRGMFLDRGDVALIADRVLLSAKAPKGRQPLTGNPKLAAFLANPNSCGSGGG